MNNMTKVENLFNEMTSDKKQKHGIIMIYTDFDKQNNHWVGDTPVLRSMLATAMLQDSEFANAVIEAAVIYTDFMESTDNIIDQTRN